MAILVVGTVFIDLKGFPFGTYIPAGRNAGRVEISHGGVGRNVVEDLGNLGLNPIFLSVLDKDGESENVRQRLFDRGVNTDYILRRENGAGMWLAVFDHGGDVVASISRRPDLTSICRHLDENHEEIFRKTDCVVIELDLEEELVDCVLKYARMYNKPVHALVANMSIALERRHLLKDLACFVCNEQEAGILFDADYTDTPANELCFILSQKLKEEGLSSMVITLGGRGSVYASASGISGFYPACKVEVKDTTGAGDAFCAGLTAGLSRKLSLRQSVALGTRLAAYVISCGENACPCMPLTDVLAELGLKI